MTKQGIRVAIIAGTVVLIDVLLIGLVVFLVTTMTASHAETRELKRKVAEFEQEQKNVLDVENTIEETEEERERIETFFLKSEEDIVELLQRMETLAEEFGLEFAPNIAESSFRYHQGEETESMPSLKIEMRASGPLPGLYRYIRMMELLPYKTAFTNLNLEMKGATAPRTVQSEDNETGEQMASVAPAAPTWSASITMHIVSVEFEDDI